MSPGENRLDEKEIQFVAESWMKREDMSTRILMDDSTLAYGADQAATS
jgi:hypothetical protein